MQGKRSTSRRNFLRSGIAVVAALGPGAVLLTPAQAEELSTRSVHSRPIRGALVRAAAVVDGAVRTTAAKGAPGATGQVASRTSEDVSGTHLTVPIVGFPSNVTPRVGDLVMVTDQFGGYAVAAVPVCRWLDGVPREGGNGRAIVEGVRVVGLPDIYPNYRSGRSVSVCVLDTELPEAQVLSVREAA